MATVTPNFNWPVPTSTDLVKDGATAIEALGDAIDTSMVDLKGGTTGQVLAKASNTDMDFSWVAQDDSNAIQNSIVDAKGDLIAATAADTPARLAVGTNGQVLTADSTASTGLAWATPSAGSTNVAGKNSVLNSDFSVWQRGTSFTSVSNVGYTADRWCVFTGSISGRDVSRQATNDTTNLPFIKYAARVGRASGNTNTTNFFIGQSYESVNSTLLAGKTITVSYYARAGANYSSTSSVLNVYAGWGTGTDQNIFAGYTGQTSLGLSNGTLTTTWQRFTTSGTLGATATEFGLYFGYTPTGTAGANDYFEITGVQVEIAGSASAYSPNTSTYQAELAACQRYYQTTGTVGVMSYSAVGVIGFTFPVQMRTTPSVSWSYTGVANRMYNIQTGATYDLVSPTTTVTSIAITNMYAFTPTNWATAAANGFTTSWVMSAEL